MYRLGAAESARDGKDNMSNTCQTEYLINIRKYEWWHGRELVRGQANC